MIASIPDISLIIIVIEYDPMGLGVQRGTLMPPKALLSCPPRMLSFGLIGLKPAEV